MTIWCAKEAYIKAVGEGLGFDLGRIEVLLDPDTEIRSVLVDGLDIKQAGWILASGYLDDEAYRWVSIHEGAQPTDMARVIAEAVEWQDVISILKPDKGRETNDLPSTSQS